MTTSRMRRAAMAVIALSLAGCATPVAPQPTVPAAVADNGAAPVVPAAAAPTEAAAPAAPAAPVAAAITVAGTAAFQGDALAGYAVRAYNAFSGAEIALASPVVTDATGKFTASFSGVAAGQYVKLVATKDNVVVEATLVAGKADAVTLDAASTFLSQVAAGPLEVAGWLSADKAGPAADAYMAALAKAQAPVTAALAAQNATAGSVVRVATTPAALSEQDATYTTVLDNAALSRPLTVASAEVVKALAPAAAASAGFRVLESTRRSVRFRGTQLQVSGGDGQPAKLTNVVTGQEVDASKPESVSNSGYVRKSSHSSSSASLFSAKFPKGHADAYGAYFFMGAIPAAMMPLIDFAGLEGATSMSAIYFSTGDTSGVTLEDGYKFSPEGLSGFPYMALALSAKGELKGMQLGMFGPPGETFLPVTPDLTNPGRDFAEAPPSLALHYTRYRVTPPNAEPGPYALAISFALNASNEVVGYRVKVEETGVIDSLPPLYEGPPPSIVESEGHRLDLVPVWPVPENPIEGENVFQVR